MTEQLHVENVRTKTVHLGKLVKGYRRPDYYNATCGGRGDSVFRLTDKPVDGKRCLRRRSE